MSEKFVVQLSEQSAPGHWGESASLSFNEHGATVHLSEQETLKNVQKAGRTIASQGIKSVVLEGDVWCTTLFMPWLAIVRPAFCTPRH